MRLKRCIRFGSFLIAVFLVLAIASPEYGTQPNPAASHSRPTLVPLLWTQGQPPETIRKVIREVAEGGNTGFVWESRPHPDYLGPQWWSDLKVAVDEARSLGLEVWLFDEWMYPSGIAGGKVVAEDPSLTRHVLRDRTLTIDGPTPEKEWEIPGPLDKSEIVISVAAFPADAHPDAPSTSAPAPPAPAPFALIDLTSRASSISPDLTRVRFAVPAASSSSVPSSSIPSSSRYHITWATSTPIPPKPGWRMDTMVDVLNPATAATFLRLTHEETYKRFAADFGRTIKGFFSDETGFRNIDSYDSLPGKPATPMPWSPVFLDHFRARKGYDPRPHLASLWYDLGLRGRAVRFDLMEAYASAFAESFFKPQQEWCRRHGVRLIGHLVEDNGADHQLGYGPGHWFRAMHYFDMPGIDIVGYQVTPGLDAGTNSWEPGTEPGWDQEFFQFGLPAMARGAALIKGSTEIFSEAFGAYGWGEGLRMVKWIGDWHFVNGIDVISPHAVSMKYHDPDCPPHFNRTSGNPQWRYYSTWAEYAKRMQTILLESVPVYDAAVLYTAESSWAGPAQTAAPIVRALESRQVSTIVLPYETWATDGEIKDGRWNYHGQSFSLVVLPSVSYIPANVMKRLADFAEQGGRVVIIDRWPEGSVDGRADADIAQAVERLKKAPSAFLSALPDIGEITPSISSIRFAPGNQRLMILRRKEKDGEWLLIHNRSLDADVVGNLYIRGVHADTAGGHAENAVSSDSNKVKPLDAEKVIRFDAEEGKYFSVPFSASPHGLEVTLNIPPGALWVLRLGTHVPDAAALPDMKNLVEVNTEWDVIELDDAGKETGKTIHVTKLEDWRKWKDWSQFAGTLRYRATIDLSPTSGPIAFDAGRVGEIAELRINGRPAGVRLAPPYLWDITAFVHPDKNTIELDVTNTAQARWSDPFSRGNPPSGLLGPVSFLSDKR